jgi:hypothetical protein
MYDDFDDMQGLGALRNPGGQWPSLTPETAAQFMAIRRGQGPTDVNKYRQIPGTYYHRRLFAAAGSTELRFFNDQARPHLSNIDGGRLPAERPMWLRAISFDLEDVTTTNNDTSIGAIIADGTFTNTVGTLARAEAKNNIANLALVQLRVGDTLVFDNTGLDTFPSGTGMAADVAGTFAAGGAAVNLHNGAPVWSNKAFLVSPFPLLPDKIIDLTVRWPLLVPITGGITIKATLWGEQLITGSF